MLATKELKSDIAYNKLKRMIIQNQLKQGTPLSERKLCELIDTSRTPVREALKRMHNDGFVDFTPEYGAFVSKVTYELVLQIYDIREMLEALAVRSFTQTANEKELNTIESIFTGIEKAANSQEYEKSLEMDMKFHHFIIDRCRNEMLQKLLRSIFEHTDRIIKLTHYSEDWSQESLKAHRKILETIKSRDSEGVEMEMRKHVRDSKKRQLASWIGQ